MNITNQHFFYSYFSYFLSIHKKRVKKSKNIKKPKNEKTLKN